MGVLKQLNLSESDVTLPLALAVHEIPRHFWAVYGYVRFDEIVKFCEVLLISVRTSLGVHLNSNHKIIAIEKRQQIIEKITF